jgi:NTP pyrophosphatase (non-canonical NTP hydrolase)
MVGFVREMEIESEMRENARPRAVLAWAVEMFGPVAANWDERAARFLEEAIELAQAEKLPFDVVRKIVDRVYARPAGDTQREVGQAMMTLECLAENLDIDAAAEAQKEFDRVRSIPKEEWTRRHTAKAALGIANLSP